jgi:hypothetical protein
MPSIKDGDGALVERYGQGKTELLGESPDLVPLCPPQIPHGFLGPPLWEAGRNQGAAYSYSSCLHVVCCNHCTSETGLWHCREPDSWLSVYSIWTKQHSISEWFNPESAIKFVNKRLIAVLRFEWTGQIWVPLPSLKKDNWTQWTSHCLYRSEFGCFVHCSLGCLSTSCKPTGDDAKPVTDPPVSMALSTMQWLECSKKNPELTTTSGCSGSEKCLLGNV